MKTSIVIATRNKNEELGRTLESIYSQNLEIEFEVIVIDDGSSDYTPILLYGYALDHPDTFVYRSLDNHQYRNPSIARNVGYRLAKGEVVIAQSDDVIHMAANSIMQLTNRLEEGTFLIATVWDYDIKKGVRRQLLTGKRCLRPFFFLGSLWRSDLYAIGGNDEEFVAPAYDDNWFGDCLMRGLGLTPVFLDEVVGHHQQHFRPQELAKMVGPSKELYQRKVEQAHSGKILWQSSGGPWNGS